MRLATMLAVAAVLMVGARVGGAQESYRRADRDAAGNVRIVTASGRITRPPRDSDQVGVEQVAVAPDHRTIGWLALYPNCCTSYPVPLELVLLRADRGRTVIRNELPIWRWAFTGDGRHVAIRQAPVHGPAPIHFELHEIRSGRSIATFESDSAAPTSSVPRWVRTLLSPPFTRAPSRER